jgi:Mce-associated membrane protein
MTDPSQSAPSRSVRRRTATRGRALTLRPASSPALSPPPEADDPTPAHATEDPTPAPAETPKPARAPRATPSPERLHRRWRLLATGLSVLLVAALAGAGLLGRDLYDKRQIESAHQQALAAARQATVDFISISAATVDKDIERITASATGDFQDQFTRSAAQVRSAVVQNKVSSQGTVLRTGLVSGDTRNAVVLVAVDATIKNKAAPAGKLSHYRIRVDLTRNHQSGQWLVSQLQFVG